MVFGNTPRPGRSAKDVGLAGPTLGRLGPGFVPRRPFVSYCLWTSLVLDIIKICIDFGPYDAFLLSDVPVMVYQKNSGNSLVISSYLLYLEWNICMLAINICILWPSTPSCTWSWPTIVGMSIASHLIGKICDFCIFVHRSVAIPKCWSRCCRLDTSFAIGWRNSIASSV
jgi:hypothetical protein